MTTQTAESIATRLHDEFCTDDCERPAEGYWLSFGAAVERGDLTYEEARDALTPP